VRGWPAAAGSIDHALTRETDPYDQPDSQASSQAASTEYRSLARIELGVTIDRYPSTRYALVELKPLTGRRHQLRRHMKHINHPIIGDSTHGKGRHNRYFQQAFDCHRMLLACMQLRLHDPASEQALTICAPLGDQFATLLERFNWTAHAAIKG
jgi:tRNA pseudouridine65 synthase